MSRERNELKARALKIFEVLKREYPDAGILLHSNNPFQLLVATILSAQCTDERVNMVTPELFARYPDPESLANADRMELEELIRSTGFYRNKAKSLLNMSKALVEKYDGRVPESVEELARLPGVGRKTGSVVAGNYFDAPVIIVDTHVKRVTGRLGLTGETDPNKIEAELKELIPEKLQTRFSYVVNFHGRFTCKARKPDCENCSVSRYCDYASENKTEG